ncbi:phage tail tape measure protein [Clostridium butyricum]|uniref:phage tail tape measure protein n=1 Tax=Clostridium butyricum TaxID=1492 RepID=UPI003D334A85
MARKEIYSLDIKINVNGDKESSNKVKKVEETAEKAKKKLKDLGNQTASPTAKLNDKMSSPLEKLESKTKSLSDRTISPTAKLKDNATSGLDKVKSATEKLNNKEAKIKVDAEDKASSVIEKANNKLNSWLKAGTKKVISIALAGTLAMGGFGATTAINTFSNFEYGMKTVQATSQATEADLSKLTNTAKNLGATTSFSAVEVSQGMNYLAMAGYKTNDIISAMPGLLNAAAASGEDLASTSDIISDAITAFGMKASDTNHLSDVMAQASANANTNIGLLGESFKYVGATMGAMKYSIEDTSIALGLMANAGVKGSMGGTSLKNAIVNMVSPTKTMAAVMEKYKLSLTDSEGNMKSLKGVMDMLREKMGGLDTATQAAAASDLFGKEAMSGMLAIINAGTSDYDKLTTAIYGADGAAKKMADTKLDSLSGQWTILKSAVEGMNIALGERLAPYAKQFVTWFTGKIPDITDGIVNAVDYLSNHTEDIKETAIAIGTVVTAIAGFNIAGSIGNSISGISNLVSLFKGASVAKDATEAAAGISKVGLSAKILPALFSPVGLAITAGVAATAVGVHEYNKLMNESILTAKEDLDPIERFMDSISGNMHKSKAELEELNIIYDDFGEGVSESFKNAAKDASKSLLNIEMDINRLTRNGTLDEGGVNTFKNYVNDFAYEGINAMKEQKDKIESEFNKTFMLDGVLNETEKNVTESLSEYFETGINKQMQLKEDIYGILNKTFVDHSKDLDTAMAEIKGKLAEIKSLELEYTKADNAYEQAYAQDKFKTDASKVASLDGASELLQSRAEEHNKQLDEIDHNYVGTLAYYDSLLSNENLNETERENFEKGKEEAEKARDEAFKQIKDNWTSDLETFYKECSPAKDKNGRKLLNEDTGDVFGKGDFRAQDMLSGFENKYPELSNVNKDGYYALQNSATNELETLYVSIDQTTGRINGVLETATGQVGGYSEEYASKVQEMAEQNKSATSGIIESLEGMKAHVDLSNNSIVSSYGTFSGAIQNVTELGDGLYECMARVNEQDVVLTVDSKGAIRNIHDVESSLSKIPSYKQVLISVATSSVVNSLGSGASKIAESINQHASGTNYATSGLSTIDERGWELADRTVPVLGQYNNNPLVNLEQGTKIKSHMNSVNDMRAAVQQEVARKTPKQKVEVYQPQVAMAGGGNQFSFGGMNINVNGNQDVEAMIQEAMQQFGQNLRDAFTNIKK